MSTDTVTVLGSVETYNKTNDYRFVTCSSIISYNKSAEVKQENCIYYCKMKLFGLSKSGNLFQVH